MDIYKHKVNKEYLLDWIDNYLDLLVEEIMKIEEGCLDEESELLASIMISSKITILQELFELLSDEGDRVLH